MPCRGGNFFDFDPLPLLPYLPPLEAELFWLLHVKNKNQKDCAKLLGLSQPTCSYRWRRALSKIAYLMLVTAISADGQTAKAVTINLK